MVLESQAWIVGLITMGTAILGYFLRDAHAQIHAAKASIDDLRGDVNRQAVVMATDYAQKTELHGVENQLEKFTEGLFGKLDKISDRMDERMETLSTRIDDKLERSNQRLEQRLIDVDRAVSLKQDRP